MKRLYILTLCAIALATCICVLKRRSPTTIAAGEGLVIPKEWLITNKNTITPKKDIRPADQTFLTYPEWFLVFSPEEQANYFKKHTSTTFPFMKHTAQIWESYKIVNDQIKDSFPKNTGYHFMIWVIGTSASVEYAVKGWYEKIVGRITDTHEPIVGEDQFNLRFTQDYVNFIKETPWYEFDFKSRLQNLWTTTAFFGENFFRKIERKYILTSELFVKWVYVKLIGLGTKQMYEEALLMTAVVLDNDSLQYLPRYDRFAKAAADIANQGRNLKEIAGNNSAILLTILIPSIKDVQFNNTQTVFIQPIASDTTMKRLALAVPVSGLNKTLLRLKNENIMVEHVFDY